MEDDDVDFTPNPNTSSNLNSLFGFNEKPLKGNLSLTYTAPKAPKKISSSIKSQSSDEEVKFKMLVSKQVHSFKLENRAYVTEGLTQIIISGNSSLCIYEMVIYKPNNDEISHTRISKNFSFILSPNNYASFYDNNKQNWSIMFSTPYDVAHFATVVACCKFYSSQERAEILIQDLTPSYNSETEAKIEDNSVVDITYKIINVQPEKIYCTTKHKDITERINLCSSDFIPFKEGLIGCSKNSKRAVIVPRKKCGKFLFDLDSDSDLLLRVKIDKIFPESEDFNSQLSSDEVESSVHSRAEDSSVKARGVSINEALTSTMSQKGNLISRMARMGQATLPLKQDLNIGLSNSEQNIDSTASSKPRRLRNRVKGNQSYQTFLQPQVAVLQNDLAQQSKLGTCAIGSEQVIPVCASPTLSPTTDPNISVYVSESRVQAAELRMGISKVSDKLDVVLSTLQTLNSMGTENKIHSGIIKDPSSILSSIQILIAENEGLKGKVEEQKGKIEQQNDRIFQLLELNHKYLEKNSNPHEKQAESEVKLKTETELEAENKRILERLKILEEDLAKAEQLKSELLEANKELNRNMDELREKFKEREDSKNKEIENWEAKMSKSLEIVNKLRDRLREVILENENLNSVINSQKEEIEARKEETKDSKMKNEEYVKVVEGLKKQISVEENKTETKFEDLTKVVTKLEEENINLKLKLEEEKNANETKKILNRVMSSLQGRFVDSKAYSAKEILSAIKNCFRDAVGVSVPLEDHNEKSGISESLKQDNLQVNPPDVHTPTTSISEVVEKEIKKEESEEKEMITSPEEKKEKIQEQEIVTSPAESEINEEEKNKSENKKESDSRYKSYDQSWRTAKPPPPPLFDDEDDDDDWLN